MAKNRSRKITELQKRVIELVDQYQANPTRRLYEEIDALSDEVTDLQAQAMLSPKPTDNYRHFDEELNRKYGAALASIMHIKPKE